jgi:thioredoxin-like negative regulator of GroEL
VACSFALLVNVLLLCSFVWDEVASAWTLRLAWSGVVGVWVAAALFSATKWPQPVDSRMRAPTQDLFPEALAQYLQGNWFQAETLCRRLLRAEERDAEARLMLATVLRRSGRKADAAQELDRLSALTSACSWYREIALERQRLAAPPAVETSSTDTTSVVMEDPSPPQVANNRRAA